MPSSFHYHITQMVEWLIKIQPRSVLDIGVGFGKWGFLAREYLDISESRYQPAEWQVRIDGVEAFPAYATPTYNYIYSNVYYGDVRTLLPQLPDYDVVILGDVIEHFTKAEGLALLRQLKRKSKFILMSSPTFFFQQAIMGNAYETHLSLWKLEDLEAVVGSHCEYEEFRGMLFAAALRGDLATAEDPVLNSWAAHIVYSRKTLRAHPKLAALAKTFLRRLPQAYFGRLRNREITRSL
jgi:hypothetical protein